VPAIASAVRVAGVGGPGRSPWSYDIVIPIANVESTTSSAVTPSAARPGVRAIWRPSRAAGPSVCSFAHEREGQNSARPVIAAMAGISVTPATSITSTEIATAGPITRNCPNSASSIVVKAATIASAAEAITGPTPPAARDAAVRRSSPIRSRSRSRNSRNRK
jgi:hypothetical protein